MRLLANISVISILLLLLAASCKQKGGAAEGAKTEYTCPMHPQIIRGAPGSCPICGMDLVRKETGSKQIEDVSLTTLLRPTNQYAVSALPVTTVQHSEIPVTIRSQGSIAINTSSVGTISALASGRIERLYIRYRNQEVNKGTRIMDIYSPELVTAQQNLLFLLQYDRENRSMIEAAKTRLRLLGMTAAQVSQLIRSRKPDYTVTVFSNYAGLIHDVAGQSGMGNPNATAQSMSTVQSTTTSPLALREGMYVQKGQATFNVVRHASVWAILNIFQEDAALIQKGDKVQIVSETHPDEPFTATISYIEPLFREGSKTLTARAVLDGTNHNLPIGSRVTATIYGAARSAWILPREAVLSLGRDKVVMRKQGGGFAVHKVTTGYSDATSVQIISGLNANDSVAMNAQYLIDSESFIKTENGQ